MYTIVWAYKVSPEKRSEFEKIYAADGAWAKLFKKGKGYLGTDLIHSAVVPENYATVDNWESEADYEAFLARWRDEYEKLDQQCQGLTEEESCLGRFGNGFSSHGKDTDSSENQVL